MIEAFKQIMPWFIYDIFNAQLITSKSIPAGDIRDTKDIFLSETPIPGLGFNPINTGGMGNKKISFTLPILNKDNNIGNLAILKQFDNLRNLTGGIGLSNIFGSSVQFDASPRVLFFWGAGTTVPLEYYVKKCDFSHLSSLVNAQGQTQYTNVDIELWLNENSELNRAEAIFRRIAPAVGALAGLL